MSVISRQRVLEILCEECAYRCRTEEIKLKCCFNYQMISELPCADVKPVVQGEWEEIDRDAMGEKTLQCGKCGKRTKGFFEPNFCPNCGADMRERSEEE